MADNPHLGHRKRLKTRAAAHGFASLAPHEHVELLLCYAIPQGNVNPLAHRLIDRFGSLAGICRAPREELLAVEGVGAHTAALLGLIPELVQVYLKDEAAPVARYDTADKLADLLVRHYTGAAEESVCLLLFGGKMDLLAMEELCRGSVSAVPLSVRTIIERAVRADAVCVVLAHNHPGGLALPSSDDLCATQQLAAALDLVGIPLLEHFVVAGSRAAPILMRENLGGRLSALEPFSAPRFYHNDAPEETP